LNFNENRSDKRSVEAESKYEQLISECDQLIKAGKISTVSNRISQLSLAQVPRAHRQALAKICRRAGLIGQGLRLLQPVIRNEKSKEIIATAGEKCEYSVLLSRNGSVQEAMNLLEGVDALDAPEVLTSLAYCHMARWEYSKAAEFLEKFLESGADPYSKLIARVNLAASYLATSKLLEADLLCTKTIDIAELAGATRLVGNCLEIRGQVHFRNGDFAKARLDLNRASEVFGGIQSYDQLFIIKWQAVMTALESKSPEPLLKFREEAVSRKHWESVRDADLFLLKVQFDQKLLDYLVFGTPLPAYRERILEMIGAPASPTFILGSATGPSLDLRIGQAGKVHDMVKALLRDFYVPRNVGSLFSEIYPDEYFDINSSPLRVRQLMWRTRHWLGENKIPALIHQDEATYRLSLEGNFGVLLDLEQESVAPVLSSARWIQLKDHFAARTSFTAQEATESLGCSRATFNRLAEEVLLTGELQKTGIGKSTVYQIRPKALNAKTRTAA
jgi:tetratricopeptide (TPR) repeat protein